jgi:hypothetical protein
MRYFGALSQGNASVIWRASHSAVGLRITANQPCLTGDSDRVHLSMCGDVMVSEHRVFGLRQRFAIAIYNDRPKWPIAALRGGIRELCGMV